MKTDRYGYFAPHIWTFARDVFVNEIIKMEQPIFKVGDQFKSASLDYSCEIIEITNSVSCKIIGGAYFALGKIERGYTVGTINKVIQDRRWLPIKSDAGSVVADS